MPPKRYVDRKESKSRDIKKALTHRARLRKGYFKLLEQEGESIPEKDVAKSEERAKPTMNYAERAKIAKQRKEEQRKEKLERVQDRRKAIEKKDKERELKKLRLSQKTKTGQPLMGPRINNLLEKIRKDVS
ncbi:rRNA processing [Suhomyces tanzawaensis NRRL Y-17324]|uniref:rRNA-processing protein FYV7 n=1 Tax=Suhomyces tanzawaensis NRRL Y-17324 TaxID=984487 RepID=A0A1E4SH44_9ASCO|nr:rRNA processing [Suhomyces tanzawaensis NRRL Y-17324]ODV78807.1 rRNA processing [Suhomyces tanzawaensis NRRL Y-17324]